MVSDATPTVGSLTWGIRQSFLSYVIRVAGGTCAVSRGVTLDDDGLFTFPLRNAVEVNGDWGLYFSGTVHLTGHHGVLDVEITDPEFIVERTGGVLLAQTGLGRVTPIAVTRPITPEQTGLELVWQNAPASLLDTAVATFGDVYPAGTDLSPVSVRLQLTQS